MIVGGASGLEFLRTSEAYDPSSDEWRAKGRLNQEGLGHTVTLLPDGKVLLVGGTDLGEVFSRTELYDPAIENWIKRRRLAFRPGSAQRYLACRWAGAGGGRFWRNKSHKQCGIYDPGSGSFQVTGSMKVARVSHTATLLNSGKVLIVGGDADRQNY